MKPHLIHQRGEDEENEKSFHAIDDFISRSAMSIPIPERLGCISININAFMIPSEVEANTKTSKKEN